MVCLDPHAPGPRLLPQASFLQGLCSVYSYQIAEWKPGVFFKPNFLPAGVVSHYDSQLVQDW